MLNFFASLIALFVLLDIVRSLSIADKKDLENKIRIPGHEHDAKETRKHSFDDPSFKKLEDEIRIAGHGNELKKTNKASFDEPSVDELEKKIKISGHEKDTKQTSPKLKVEEPSNSKLEESVRIPGHEELKKETIRHKVDEPSVNDLEAKLKIEGHEKEKKEMNKHKVNEPSIDRLGKKVKLDMKPESTMSASEKKIRQEPSIDRLEKSDLLYRNPKLRLDKPAEKSDDAAKQQQQQKQLEPSLTYLEKQIAIPVSDSNKTTVREPLIILPGYEGFHGVMNHDDEGYQHGAHEADERAKNKAKSADLDDYKAWLDNQQKVSKLVRFKKLHEEFSQLSKRRHTYRHRDDDRFLIDPSSLNEENVVALNLNSLVRMEEKLVLTIKKLEEEERKRKKAKTDL